MNGDGRGTRTLAAAALRAAAGGAAPPPAELRVLDGPLAGCRLALGGDETLGRGAEASLRLPDPAASRRHLALRPVPGGVRARDLGSKNGWELNGHRRRRERLLRQGDVIAVGTTRLALELAPAAGPDPEAPGPRAERAAAGTGAAAARPAAARLQAPRGAAAAALLLALAAAAVLAAR